MFIDTFTSLDGLTKAQAKDDLIVLAALKRAKRFSCWDMDGARQLWRAVKRLTDSGHITLSHRRTVPGQANEPDYEVDTYPWTAVTLTPAGEGRLIAAKATAAAETGTAGIGPSADEPNTAPPSADTPTARVEDGR